MSYKQILQLMLLIAQTCIMVCAQDYDQPYRPQVHFSPVRTGRTIPTAWFISRASTTSSFSTTRSAISGDT